MTILELEKKLKEINLPEDLYSILKGGFPSEQFCIVKENNIWSVYYSERGRKSGLKTFTDESNACEYFYNILKKYAE